MPQPLNIPNPPSRPVSPGTRFAMLVIFTGITLWNTNHGVNDAGDWFAVVVGCLIILWEVVGIMSYNVAMARYADEREKWEQKVRQLVVNAESASILRGTR